MQRFCSSQFPPELDFFASLRSGEERDVRGGGVDEIQSQVVCGVILHQPVTSRQGPGTKDYTVENGQEAERDREGITETDRDGESQREREGERRDRVERLLDSEFLPYPCGPASPSPRHRPCKSRIHHV